MSAGERREMAIEAAVAAFARGGYEGTSTGVIAERIGVSQPYMFRLFPSKRALFLAAVDRCFDEVGAAMREGAGGLYGPAAIEAMAAAYRRLLGERPEFLQLQLTIYATAIADEELRAIGHERWRQLWRLVAELSGASPAEVLRFISVGMFVNVLTAFDIPYTPGTDKLAPSVHEWAMRGGEPGSP